MGDHHTEPWPKPLDKGHISFHMPKTIEPGDEIVIYGLYKSSVTHYYTFEIEFQGGTYVPDRREIPISFYYYYAPRGGRTARICTQTYKTGIFPVFITSTMSPDMDSTPYFDGLNFVVRFKFGLKKIFVYMKDLLVNSLPWEHNHSDVKFFSVIGPDLEKVTKVECVFPNDIKLPGYDPEDYDKFKYDVIDE